MPDRARHDIHVSSAILGADLTQAEKMVYIAIRSRQGNNPWCFASQQVIADDIGSAKAFVNRTIKKLKDGGWIEKEGRKMRCLPYPNGDSQSTNVDQESPSEDEGSGDQESTSGDSQSPTGDQESPRTENQQGKPTNKANNDSHESEPGSEKGDPSGDPESNGKDPSPDEEDEDERSPPEDPTMKHPAVGIYRSIFKLTPNEEQRKLLVEHIDASSTEQLNTLKEECRLTLRQGWRKTNIPRLLERTYENLDEPIPDEIAKLTADQRNGKTKRTGASDTGRAASGRRRKFDPELYRNVGR